MTQKHHYTTRPPKSDNLVSIPLQVQNIQHNMQNHSILYRLYIGANNISREVETQKIRDRVAVDYPQRFTIIPAAGNWKLDTGSIAQEDSNIVEILAPAVDQDVIVKIATDLKTELDQEAIMLTQHRQIVDFI